MRSVPIIATITIVLSGGAGADRSVRRPAARGAHSVLNGAATSPVDLLAVDPSAPFTAPNQISNQYGALSLTGDFSLSSRAAAR